jgi:uncharacterized protein
MHTPSHSDSPSAPLPTPVAEAQRILSIDALRGFALCGILLMNILTFAAPFAMYMNPAAVERPEGADLISWVVAVLFFDLKFMTIFSMLFGAGLALMADRAASRGPASDPNAPRPQGLAAIFYRRTGLLILFGVLHAYLIWYGDILFFYGVCGLFLYLMRNWRPSVQLVVACVLMIVPVLMFAGVGASLWAWHEHGGLKQALEAQAASLEGGPALTEAQAGMIEGWTEAQAGWQPTPEELEKERAAHLGSWHDTFLHRAELAIFMQIFLFPMFAAWRCGGMMLVGIALARWGVLSAERSTRFYVRLACFGYGLGLPLCALSAWDLWSSDFEMIRAYIVGLNLNYLGSLGVAMGHIALVMLAWKLWRTGVIMNWIMNSLAAMGRMALTNYIAQSVICTAIFDGWGLGLFGSLSRPQMYLIVPGIWLVQALWSPWWLKRFQYGPLEWLWRTLTYLRRQPMHRAKEPQPVA